MPNPRTIHVVPHAGGVWEVRMDGGPSPLKFCDLGHALDAAIAISTSGATTRVVVHEPKAA